SLDTSSRLSIRNKLAGTVIQLSNDIDNTVLVHVDVGNVILIARITRSAVLDLQLKAGTALWVLVKAVTLRGHVFATARTPEETV
ncbi:MAG: TOBE domain-containing protein, partial [Steroidobacter sp.]